MTIKLGIVGVGHWGPNLLRVFNSLPDCSVTRVCDTDPKKLDSFRSQYREAEFTTDFDDVIHSTDTDAIVIAIPASMHYEFALKALEAGKHCFVEKPLATSSTECRELVETAEKRGLTLMVGHTFEYNSAVRYVRDLIDKGDLGTVYQIFSQRLNLGQVRSDVDAIWNLAPHDVSIALFWLHAAKPVAVTARGFAHIQAQQGIHDMGYITMEFDNNAVAHMVVSWLSPEKIRKSMVTGSRKMVVYDDVSVDGKVKVFEKGVDMEPANDPNPTSFGEYQLYVRSGDLVVPNFHFVEPLKVECSHFVESIMESKQPISDGRSGLRVTAILEAATDSMARGGARVQLDDL